MPPLVLLIAIVVIDYHTARDFRIISWLVLVPGIAAAICGVWGTAAFALLSTFTYLVADSILPNEYQAGPADFALSAIGGVLATLACAVRVRGEARMLHMRDVAETIRRTVLRPLPSPWGGLDHAAVYLTADVEAAVGGDFYDVQPGPQGTRVLIGDVQGKGCLLYPSGRPPSTSRTSRSSRSGWRPGWSGTPGTWPPSAGTTATASPPRSC